MSSLVSPVGWLIAGLVLAGFEMLVPGIYLLWLGLGALAVAGCLALLPELSLATQLILFAVASLLSVGLGMRIQRASKSGPDGAAELNHVLHGLIGQRFLVTQDFKAGRGRIRVQDSSYAASAAPDAQILAGNYVEVVEIVAGRVHVRPITESHAHGA